MSKTQSDTVDRNIRKAGKKYKANVTINGKQKYVGTYKTLEEAASARKEAEKELFDPVINDFNKTAKYKVKKEEKK